MNYADSVLDAASLNEDSLLTESQVYRLLSEHGASLSEMLREIPANEGQVWRSPEYILAWLGY